jgi:hypothetical protein
MGGEGGLDIKDLDKFARALRLRWLWHQWDEKEKPWKHLLRITDKKDRQLFFQSTKVQIGNGRNTPFWEARWLQGVSPKELAPNLNQKARYKFRTVYTELQNSNWIKNLTEINSATQLDEFTLLFMTLAPLSLTEHNDTISWTWTADGKYSAALAYDCQYLGAMSNFADINLWSATAEQKTKFFAWLALHNRVLTADNMMKKHWSCEPTCALCSSLIESTEHILSKCNYTEAVWDIMAHRFNLPQCATLNAKPKLAEGSELCPHQVL